MEVGWLLGGGEALGRRIRPEAEWRRRACRRRFEAPRELILEGERDERERVVGRCSMEAGGANL